jgi:hypothetical protein
MMTTIMLYGTFAAFIIWSVISTILIIRDPSILEDQL